MERRPVPLPEARRVLALARTDKRSAEQQLAALPLEAQVAVVCEAPVATRARLIELMPHPEAVIPLLPEAELCFTTKAVGIEDAGWILEHATDEQLTACIDLDAWRGLEPAPRELDSWIATLAEAGEDTLVRAARALDPEVIVLYLRAHVSVMLDPKDDDWQPPPGAQTLEGQFYLLARSGADDLEPVMRLLHGLFRQDYWLYFRLMQGVVWEVQSDLEEWALRWRTGRLEDLGFPAWDESMRIYGYVRPDERARIAEEAAPIDADAWNMPVWMPGLPALEDSQLSIFQAIAELEEETRGRYFLAFVSLANKVAVADRLALGDAETLPKALQKAAELTSLGLEWIAKEHSRGLREVLERTTLERLFQVGASLDPTARPVPRPEPEEPPDDEQSFENPE